jgi:glycosyltransferase involved in cell wall biosynthesis
MLIPHFDHLEQFQTALPALVMQGFPLVVVDDASPKPVFVALSQLLEEIAPGSILVRHPENLGKGGAVMTGLKVASEAGFTHALQIDADGQHDVAGIAQLAATATQHPNSMICGQPKFDKNISRLRFYARYITLFLVWFETLSTEILDALCGFRAYPLKQVGLLIQSNKLGERMTFDPEILVRAVWAGIPLHYVPIKTVYPEDGKSHFRYFRDNLQISWMHTRLIFGMLIRLPTLIRRNWIRNTTPATK